MDTAGLPCLCPETTLNLPIMFINPLQFVIGVPIFILYLISGSSVIWPLRKNVWVRILFYIGALYPFGELLQSLSFLPSLIRWHTSDFGILATPALLAFLWWRGLKGFRMAKIVARTCCLTLVAWELIFLATLGEKLGGDLWDVATYCASYFVVVNVIDKIKMTQENLYLEAKRNWRKSKRELKKLQRNLSQAPA